MSLYDTESLYEFLLHTPEGGLRKMLVDKNRITDVHFNFLMKIVRSCSAEQFAEHFGKHDYPKIRLGPAESKIKDRFWQDCTAVLLERGILQSKANAQKMVS
jgi:hypothetical protein